MAWGTSSQVVVVVIGSIMLIVSAFACASCFKAVGDENKLGANDKMVPVPYSTTMSLRARVSERRHGVVINQAASSEAPSYSVGDPREYQKHLSAMSARSSITVWNRSNTERSWATG